MADKIFVSPEGFTEIIFEGTQTAESISKMVEQSLIYNEKLSSAGKEIKTLVDLSAVDDIDSGAATRSITAFTTIDYDKVAIFGGKPEVIEKLADIMVLAGKELPVKQFSSREEAIAWLNE